MEAEIVKDLYDLIDKYQVPTPPEDLAVYQVNIIYVYSQFQCIVTACMQWD